MQVLMDATDIQIFDYHTQELISHMEFNMRTELSIKEGKDSTFYIRNAGVDLDFLESFNATKVQLTDFEKTTNQKVKIKLDPNVMFEKRYRIVAKGIMYDRETSNPSHDFYLVIYSAKLDDEFLFEAICSEASLPQFVFKIERDLSSRFVELELEPIKN